MVDLGDLLRDDLDSSKHGVGWWDVYAQLNTKTRIFISDYLVSCACDVATNLLEAYGARYLRDVQHADPMLCRLVANHSCAIIEAEERGLSDVLRREFEAPPRPLADALTCCDMTTSPVGDPVNVDRRLAEILHRYGSDHLVSRSVRRATPMILRAVGQVHARATATR
jgi:hypothetical protein